MQRCSISQIARSGSKIITRSSSDTRPRWTSNGRRTARKASSTSSRPAPKRSHRSESPALSRPMRSRPAVRYWSPDVRSARRSPPARSDWWSARATSPPFTRGEVLVAEATSPDWEPVMKSAGAIVTSRGGRTCHAAIVARELGVPAVVGAEGALEKLRTGAVVTVSCAEGEAGKVYDGQLPFEVTRVPAGGVPRPRTEIMLNLANPELAYHTAMLPNDGVGLARMEFIINNHIGVHPMALVSPGKVASRTVRAAIARLVRNYPRPTDFFVEKLAEGI